MVEMGNQSATINAQIGQAKSETERIKAQVQVFQNSTVAGNELHAFLRPDYVTLNYVTDFYKISYYVTLFYVTLYYITLYYVTFIEVYYKPS